MERFNYPTLSAAENEDIRIIQMLEAESWGKRMDEKEELEEQELEMQEARMRADADGQ